MEKIEKPTRTVNVISVDELKSPTPLLITQMNGFLTMKRYQYAAIYTDKVSRISYVYLQNMA